MSGREGEEAWSLQQVSILQGQPGIWILIFGEKKVPNCSQSSTTRELDSFTKWRTHSGLYFTERFGTQSFILQ